ncbi:DUF2786 domain-containing protein [Nocardia sp. NPDC049149]|uniref:DUF2786 domain-containing protein n=1 Tax=Nocardia sp. NPDC049149 TaxID=3364315 RepID=UPI003718A469
MDKEQEAKVVRRVRAMLQAATDDSNENESAAKRQKAWELIAQYGLDNDPRIFGGRTAEEDQMIRIRVPTKAPFREQRMLLLGSVALALHTRPIIVGHEVHIVGVRCHVDRVKMIYPIIEVQMIGAASKRVPEDPFDRSGVRRDRIGYMTGFAGEAMARIVDFERQAVRGTRREAEFAKDKRRTDAAYATLYPYARDFKPNQGDRAGMAAGSRSAHGVDLGQSRVGDTHRAIES